MKKLINLMIVLVLSVFLVACKSPATGGDEGGGGEDVLAPVEVKTGVFIDSFVQGLSYVAGSQAGTTNSLGEFSYIEGDTVMFKIGGISFSSSIPADGRVTPLTVFRTTNISHVGVVNMARLLQSLDADGNPSNGILISSNTQKLASEVIDLDFESETFEDDVSALMDEEGVELVSADSAKEHLTKSLSTVGEIVTSELPVIKLVGNIVFSSNPSGNIVLLGEVENTGGTGVFIEAKCSYDSLGGELEVSSSFVRGSVVKLTNIDTNTNTALKKGEKGVFKVITNMPASSGSSVDCTYPFSVTQTEDPVAKLELDGDKPLSLAGQVKNSGSMGLTFGQVIFALKDAGGRVLDVESTFIDGETVELEFGGVTSTALRAGNGGIYFAISAVDFVSYDVYFDWNDTVIQ